MRTYQLAFILLFAALAHQSAGVLGGGAQPPLDHQSAGVLGGGVHTRRGAWAEPAKVVKSQAQWRQQLTPKQYQILRERATEPAFSGEYDRTFAPGSYHCAACQAELFASDHKFNSGCGWPAFFAVAAKERVRLLEDSSHGMQRIEVRCARCDGHLGHLFDDGPKPSGQRYCINSASLIFRPRAK